jgi:hypothetical protein
MLKLSKNHMIKIAEEDKMQEEFPLHGSEVIDADDVDTELDAEAEDHEEEKGPKYDARREAATPHANAAKDLFNKRRELMGQVNMLDEQLSKHREVLRALDPKMKHEAYADDKELKHYLKPEKSIEKKKKRKLDKHSETEVVKGLLKVAEMLDYAGHVEGVSYIENMLSIFANKDEMPKYDVKNVDKSERKYPDVSAVAPSLSIRHCPDHHGAQMARVAEGSFQCNIDGRIYNWNSGFKDYDGNIYPGASITSVDFPNNFESLFETREMATRKNQK